MRLTPLVALGGAVFALYVLILRPWQLRWGATEVEARRCLPGDEVVTHPVVAATRAVTIEASPAEIWPWLAQMGGYTRAGWYSYDRFDNAGRPSADRIIPELQRVAVGDVFLTSPDEGFTVREFEVDRYLLLVIDTEGGVISSLMYLEAVDGTHTRLIARLRAYFPPRLMPTLFGLMFDPGDFVFMRKTMLGIKQRAERSARGGAQEAKVTVRKGTLWRRAPGHDNAAP